EDDALILRFAHAFLLRLHRGIVHEFRATLKQSAAAEWAYLGASVERNSRVASINFWSTR
ncbi:MAG: hypothetical protein RLZZ303_1043, partial [Candidatus Hydrogenedentota bacterium]